MSHSPPRHSGREPSAPAVRLFSLSCVEDREAFEQLLASSPTLRKHDTIDSQLEELLRSRNPSKSAAEITSQVEAHVGGENRHDYGTWVHYPWSERLVHVLPREEFREVRADRNRHKITSSEQAALREATIGIVGLSVGQSAALTMALEGVGGRFRIADFDELELGNMNRLRAGVHEIGLLKTTIAARGMLEVDPYLEIQVFDQGLDDGNIEDFFSGQGDLDLLVDECDDLYMKVRLRERARELGLPVLMDTSDRGMLDIERFDLEPDRPILHGLLSDLNAELLRDLDTDEKVPHVLRILGEEQLSTRLLASMVEIGESVSTWPQLGSAVALGGALVTHAARRVLLGELRTSGRFYVDLDGLIRAGGDFSCDGGEAPDEPTSEEALRPASLPSSPTEPSTPIPRATLERIITAGTYAPSAGNTQPWRFEVRGDLIQCLADQRSAFSALDHEGRATVATFGAVVENMALVAASLGYRSEVDFMGEREHIADLRLSPAETKTSPLVAQIPLRVTNRRNPSRTAVPPDDLQALAGVAEAGGGCLHLLTEGADLDALSELMAGADRVVFLNERMHADTMSEFRWTREEVERSRDGLDVKTLELSPADLAGLRVIARSEVMDTLARIGAGKGLGAMSRRWVRSASAMALLTMPGPAPRSFFEGGRVMQRVWLTASARGVGLQPMTSLPYLFGRLDQAADDEVLGVDEHQSLLELRPAYNELFGVTEDRSQVLLCRLVMGDPPTARALRRPLEEVASFRD